MNTTDDVLAKIRKLLALAQDASATAGEAEAALGRAAHLQRLAGITDEQIRAHVHATGTNGTAGVTIDKAAVREQTIHKAGRLGRWDAWTASACAQAVGCKTYHTGGRGVRRIVAYGLPQDIAVCAELFAFALVAGAKATARWSVDTGIPTNHREAKSFRDGFCLGLFEAAKRATAAAAADATPVPVPQTVTMADGAGACYALVPVSGALVHAAKTAAVAQYSAGLHLRSGGGYRLAGGSSDSYGAGRAAGAATSLARGVIR